jgi:hypothetical protein
MITDLPPDANPVLIGDMNFPYDTDMPDGEQDSIEKMNWTKISPGFPTFKKKKGERTIIDYIWIDKNSIKSCTSTELIPNYPHWDMVDHAPIAYTLEYE